MNVATCLQSPRMQYCTPEKIAEQFKGVSSEKTDDVMSRCESIWLVSAYNRIANRALAKFLLGIIMTLGHYPSIFDSGEPEAETIVTKKSNKHKQT